MCIRDSGSAWHARGVASPYWMMAYRPQLKKPSCYSRRRRYDEQWRLWLSVSVYLSVCPRSEGKATRAINTNLGSSPWLDLGMPWPWSHKVKCQGHSVIKCAADAGMQVDVNFWVSSCTTSREVAPHHLHITFSGVLRISPRDGHLSPSKFILQKIYVFPVRDFWMWIYQSVSRLFFNDDLAHLPLNTQNKQRYVKRTRPEI